MRETLFNWLGARTQGARALDLFAGSGALGLEALSRGASHVTFVEHDDAAAHELRARLAEWQAPDAVVVRADALRYLSGDARSYQLVFLDPPFAAGLLSEAARLLDERHWLAEGALIYVECPAREGLPPLPARWQPLKAKRAGEVGYHPLTNGHTDLVRRAAGIFDKVIVAIAANAHKAPLFPLEVRVDLARRVLSDIPNVEVLGYSGLTVDLARKHQPAVIVRGLRAVSDFEFEFQLANMSRHLDRNFETVFLTPQEQFTFISSTLVREIAVLGGAVSEFVHPIVEAELKKLRRP